MNGVNKVILIGHLGSDPEVRHLESGATVANFNIATSENYTTKEGERVTQTEWHRIQLWEGLAKVAEKYLKKGSPVYIEGKLKTESWTDKEGNNRTTTRIRGLNMTMLGGRPSDQGGSTQQGGSNPAQRPAAPAAPAQAAPSPQPAAPMNAKEDLEDDLPF